MNDINQSMPRTLKVTGMSCGHCVSRVTRTLAGIPGLQVADVEIGKVRLISASDSALEEAMEELATLGYTAQVVEPEPPSTATTRCGQCSCCV